MNDIESRFKLYTFFTKLLDIDTEHKKSLFSKQLILGKGGQGKVYKYQAKNKSELAIKKVYLDKKQSKFINDIFNKKAYIHGTFIELSAFYLINELVLQKISPNFILNYDYEFIERDGICNSEYPFTGYLYNEFISNSETFKDWVKKQHKIELWYNAFFQITTAIYTLHKYFNMTHLDLHAENILVKKIKSGGYWSYIINNKTYKIPNLGYIFYINDFGHAWIPKTFTSWFITDRYCKKSIHKGYDIYDLYKNIARYVKIPDTINKDILYVITHMKNKGTFEHVIEEIWFNTYSTTSSTKLIETYNLDKKFDTTKIPKQLQHLCL